MKVRSSLKNLKTRDRNNKLIKRKGKLYIINKKNPRMKARQGQSDFLMEYIAILAFILGLPFTYTQLEVKKIENKYPPLGYFKNIDGYNIHYTDIGSGLPVVLLHSQPANERQFDVLKKLTGCVCTVCCIWFHIVRIKKKLVFH